MKILIPFSINQRKEDSAYLEHRLFHRFIYQMGEGLSIIAKDHARTIAKANLKVGRDITHALDKGFENIQHSQQKIHHALIDQTQVIQQGFDSLEISVEKGFESVDLQLQGVSQRLEHLRDTLLVSSDRLERGLSALKSSLDMGMMNIVSQFEIQREEIAKGFQQLAHLMENQQKTAARERYLDGKQAYETYLKHPEEPTFLQDAESYLHQSISMYRGNPFCHLYLGHIYHEPTHLYNLDKSLAHYKLAATYAKGIPNPELTALSYFMASWIAYVNRQLSDAIELGELALRYDGDQIPEAYYNLAKFHACIHQSERAIHYLNLSISRFDPFYALKAQEDADFQSIHHELAAYFVTLRDRAADKWTQRLNQFGVSHLLEE